MYCVAITGASGAILGVRLLEYLAMREKVFLVVSNGARTVMKHEMGCDYLNKRSLSHLIKHRDSLGTIMNNIQEENCDNLASKLASGSFQYKGIIVCPASINTIGLAAHAITNNLITRAIDVCLKEKRKCVIVPRESPLHGIHLENLLKLANCGADIMPPCVSFYHQPKSIDDMLDYFAGRILDNLNIEHRLYKRWEGSDEPSERMVFEALRASNS